MEDRQKGRYFLGRGSRGILLPAVYICFLVVAVYFALSYKVHLFLSQGTSYSMLDCMHALEQSYNFGLFYFLLTVSLVASGKKNYEKPALIIPYGSTCRVWNKLYKSFFCASVFYSIVYSLLVCIMSGLSSNQISNWDQKKSYFHIITDSYFEGNPAWVIAAFFLFTIIKTLLGVGILLLADSLLKEMSWGYFILAVPIAVEWFGTDNTVFFNLFSISPINFINPVKAAALVLFGIALNTVVYLTGRRIWKDKEFYG